MQKTFSWQCEEIMSMAVQITAKGDYITFVSYSGYLNTISIHITKNKDGGNNYLFEKEIYLSPGFMNDENHITGQLKNVITMLNNILKGKEIWKTI